MNYPSSLFSGDGGVFSLANDARVFASLSRADDGIDEMSGGGGMVQAVQAVDHRSTEDVKLSPLPRSTWVCVMCTKKIYNDPAVRYDDLPH